MATDDKRMLDILKAISTFDMQKDYNDTDARKQLSVMFRDLILSDNEILKEQIAELFQNIILSDSEASQQFISSFIDSVDDVIGDVEDSVMSTDDTSGDEVVMPDEEEPAAEGEEEEEETPEEETPAEGEGEGEGTTEETPEEEAPEDLFAGYKNTSPLVEYANTFMWS